MEQVCYNGAFSDAGQPVIPATNRSYRYGDGFFETMRVHQGAIPLLNGHLARIASTIALLGYPPPLHTVNTIIEHALDLCRLNHCHDAARIRLSFSNGDGLINATSPHLNYLIEAAPLQPANTAPLRVGIFAQGIKYADAYAGIKSASALLYSRAAQYAKEAGLDDCLIYNQHNRIAESCIANIFWIKEGKIYTPPLSEGCVAGVLRGYLIAGIGGIIEQALDHETLLTADEVFLTNAIAGIRPVGHVDDTMYATEQVYALRKMVNEKSFG